MAEGALYCMRVVGTQISRSHSADCFGSSLSTFVGLHVCNLWGLRVDHTVGLGPHLLYIYKTPSPLKWHPVDPYCHISVHCMKPKALYYC